MSSYDIISKKQTLPTLASQPRYVRNHYLQNFQHSGLSFLPARPVISTESLGAFPELGAVLATVTVP